MQVNILQPEAPTVRLWFRYDINSPFKYHRDGTGAGSWDSQSERTYDEMAKDLSLTKSTFGVIARKDSSSLIRVLNIQKRKKRKKKKK